MRYADPKVCSTLYSFQHPLFKREHSYSKENSCRPRDVPQKLELPVDRTKMASAPDTGCEALLAKAKNKKPPFDVKLLVTQKAARCHCFLGFTQYS
jgi:hypothetical protein